MLNRTKCDLSFPPEIEFEIALAMVPGGKNSGVSSVELELANQLPRDRVR